MGGAAPLGEGTAAARTLELRRGEAAPEARAQLARLAAGFESIFTATVIGELMKPVLAGEGGGLIGSGPGASVVQGLFETNLSEHLAKAGGLGIGRMIERTLGPQLAARKVSLAELSSRLAEVATPALPADRASVGESAGGR